MLILNQICPHLLHFIKSLPACVFSTPHHFITLSSVKTTLNQVQQFNNISVLKLFISPNLICTLQDLVQAPPIFARSSFVMQQTMLLCLSKTPPISIRSYTILIHQKSMMIHPRQCFSKIPNHEISNYGSFIFF